MRPNLSAGPVALPLASYPAGRQPTTPEPVLKPVRSTLAAWSAVSVSKTPDRLNCVTPVVVTPVIEAFGPQSPTGPTVMVGPPLPEIRPLEPHPPVIELLPPREQA